MSLVVDNSLASVAVLVAAGVAGYSQKTLKLTSTGAACPLLSTPELGDVQGVTAIMRALAANKKALLGNSEEEAAMVQEYLSLFNTQMLRASSITESLLDRLNTTLQRQTFLASSSATLADVAIYAGLSAAMAQNGKAFGSRLALCRWYNTVQHQLGAHTFQPAVQLMDFNFPAPSIFTVDFSKNAAAPKPVTSCKPAVSKEKIAAVVPKKAAGAAPSAEKKKPAGKPAAAAGNQQQGGGKKKKEKKEKKTAQPAKGGAAPSTNGWRLDIRVGKILSASAHPTEAKLLVEQIDVGEDEPRTVVSGLADWYKPEQLTGKLVTVITNLKAGDLKGVVSNGRVLVGTAAADKTKKEILEPADGSKPGERVELDTVETKDVPQISSKHFSKVLKAMTINGDGVGACDNMYFKTSAGPCTVPTIRTGTLA